MASKRRKDHDDQDGGCRAEGRRLVLVGAVTQAMALEVLAALGGLRGPRPARVVLSSTGGDVYAGFAIYDALTTRPFPVDVEVHGSCQSIAVLLLMAGRRRLLAPEVRVMLHDGSIGVPEIPIATFESLAAETRREHRRYCEIVAERSGRTVKEVLRWCRRETYLSAAEAISFGLADGVLGSPNLPLRRGFYAAKSAETLENNRGRRRPDRRLRRR